MIQHVSLQIDKTASIGFPIRFDIFEVDNHTIGWRKGVAQGLCVES